MEKVKAKLVKFKRWLVASITIIIVLLASFFAIPVLFPPTPPTGTGEFTQDLYPTSDITTEWAVTSPPHWSKLDEEHETPSTTDFIATESTSYVYEEWGVVTSTVEQTVYGVDNVNSGSWTNPTYAYDNITANGATKYWTTIGACGYLVINMSTSVNGTKVPYWVQRSGGSITTMEVGVANQTGSWVMVYNTTATWNAWTNATIAQSTYTALRIQFYQTTATPVTATIFEVQAITNIATVFNPIPPMPTDYTVFNVTLSMYAKRTGTVGFYFRVKTHDTYYETSKSPTLNSYAWVTTTWTTNPNTSLAWTWNEINDLNAFTIGCKGKKIVGIPYVADVYVQIYYGYALETPLPDHELLYCDGFDATWDNNTNTGTTPYVDTVDYNVNYFNQTVSGEGTDKGWFTFQNTALIGLLSATMEIRIYQIASGYWNWTVSNGTATQLFGDTLSVSTVGTWRWQTIALSSFINSPDEVSDAKVKLEYCSAANLALVDCLRLNVTYPERLIDHITESLDAVDWSFTANDSVRGNLMQVGLMFGQNTVTELNTKIDGYGSNVSTWTDCLYMSVWALKLGIERETAIKAALNNANMTSGGLPNVDSAFGYLSTEQYALFGYYWAIKYSYLLSKWNLTTAYATYETAYDNAMLVIDSPLYAVKGEIDYTVGTRFWDETASTMQTFLVFYWLLNVTQALDKAEEVWAWANNHLWMGTYYKYRLDSDTFECSSGFFLQDAALMKWQYFDMANWTYILTDIYTRSLGNNWSSPQWCQVGTTSNYVVVHDHAVNYQTRLESTLGAWFSMMGVYQLLNEIEQATLRNMLVGFNGYDPAWKLLMNDSTYLYDATTKLFRRLGYYQPDGLGYIATAWALALMFYMGIVPQTGMLAMPLEDYGYQYTAVGFDQDLFAMNLDTHSIKVAVYNGTLTFQYGSSPVNCTFGEEGVYNVTFSSGWNSILSSTKLNNLPDRKFLKEIFATNLVVGENNFSPWNVDVGKTLGNVEISLNLADINWARLTIDYGNGTQWSLVNGQTYNNDKLVISTSNTFRIYCNVAGSWWHTYS